MSSNVYCINDFDQLVDSNDEFPPTALLINAMPLRNIADMYCNIAIVCVDRCVLWLFLIEIDCCFAFMDE